MTNTDVRDRLAVLLHEAIDLIEPQLVIRQGSLPIGDGRAERNHLMEIARLDGEVSRLRALLDNQRAVLENREAAIAELQSELERRDAAGETAVHLDPTMLVIDKHERDAIERTIGRELAKVELTRITLPILDDNREHPVVAVAAKLGGSSSALAKIYLHLATGATMATVQEVLQNWGL